MWILHLSYLKFTITLLCFFDLKNIFQVTNSLVGGGDHGVPVAALGKTWQFVPHNRILLRTEKSSLCQEGEKIRHATIIKSCRQVSNFHFSYFVFYLF